MENNKLGEGNTQCLHFPALEHGDPAEFYPSIIVGYNAETGWLILRTKHVFYNSSICWCNLATANNTQVFCI
jgi:hypothetical protein